MENIKKMPDENIKPDVVVVKKEITGMDDTGRILIAIRVFDEKEVCD